MTYKIPFINHFFVTDDAQAMKNLSKIGIAKELSLLKGVPIIKQRRFSPLFLFISYKHVYFNTIELPLNLIIFGQTKSDNINRMIIITDVFYFVIHCKWDFET